MTMDVYSEIFTRASTRDFDPTPLSSEVLEQIEAIVPQVKPLLSTVTLTHRILGPDEVKGMLIAKAPHYLLVSGPPSEPWRAACATFVYQHVQLYMYSLGLAARWLGGLKPKNDDPNHIIGMAFGKPSGSARRTHEEFDRKSLSEISRGTDSRLEAARLAPSGINCQPWYFIVEGDSIHVYFQRSLPGLKGKLYHPSDLDVGLALCHLEVASEHEGKPFHFTADGVDVPEPPAGFTYLGTVDGVTPSDSSQPAD